MTMSLALAVLLASPAVAAQDADCRIITFQTAPANHAAFRREREFPAGVPASVLALTAAVETVPAGLVDGFVRTLEFIHSHSAEETLAVIPPEISGPDRATYLRSLREEIPMFAGNGRMPASAAEHEWRVLAELNPKYEPVKAEETYTNRFVDVALRGGGVR